MFGLESTQGFMAHRAAQDAPAPRSLRAPLLAALLIVYAVGVSFVLSRALATAAEASGRDPAASADVPF